MRPSSTRSTAQALTEAFRRLGQPRPGAGLRRHQPLRGQVPRAHRRLDPQHRRDDAVHPHRRAAQAPPVPAPRAAGRAAGGAARSSGRADVHQIWGGISGAKVGRVDVGEGRRLIWKEGDAREDRARGPRDGGVEPCRPGARPRRRGPRRAGRAASRSSGATSTAGSCATSTSPDRGTRSSTSPGGSWRRCARCGWPRS